MEMWIEYEKCYTTLCFTVFSDQGSVRTSERHKFGTFGFVPYAFHLVCFIKFNLISDWNSMELKKDILQPKLRFRFDLKYWLFMSNFNGTNYFLSNRPLYIEIQSLSELASPSLVLVLVGRSLVIGQVWSQLTEIHRTYKGLKFVMNCS